MLTQINDFLVSVDNFVWGVPLMVIILATGIFLTARMGLLQIRRLPLPAFMHSETPWHPLMACALFIVPGVPRVSYTHLNLHRYIVPSRRPSAALDENGEQMDIAVSYTHLLPKCQGLPLFAFVSV